MAREHFVDARPTEDWTKVGSRQTHLNGNILEKHGRTQGRDPHSDECRIRTEVTMIDADEACDTSTAKRTHDPGEPKNVRKTNLIANNSRTELVENSKNLTTPISDVNDMLCEKTSTDATHDAMACHTPCLSSHGGCQELCFVGMNASIRLVSWPTRACAVLWTLLERFRPPANSAHDPPLSLACCNFVFELCRAPSRRGAILTFCDSQRRSCLTLKDGVYSVIKTLLFLLE